jgi:hypothetical protein
MCTNVSIHVSDTAVNAALLRHRAAFWLGPQPQVHASIIVRMHWLLTSPLPLLCACRLPLVFQVL